MRLASPADEDDLAYLLSRLPAEIPVTVIGVGSNLIVRDGGVRGVVIRLGGRAFGAIETAADHRLVAGAAALDSSVAKAAAEAADRWPRLPARRARRDRRRAAHERRRARRRDQRYPDRGPRLRSRGAAAPLRQRRDGLFLSPQRGAGRRHLHPRGLSGPAGRTRSHRNARWSASRRRAKPRSRSARRPAARRSRTRRITRRGR